MRIFLVTLCFFFVAQFALAAQSEFSLEPGEFFLITKYQFSDNEKLIEQTDRVRLSFQNGGIQFRNSEQPEFPIVGQLVGNTFVAHMDDAVGTVEFKGSLVAINHVIGQMSGHSKTRANLSGSFEIKPATD